MSTDCPVKILALLGEMARCLNQNMSKVKITPLDPAYYIVNLTAVPVTTATQASQS